MCVTVALEFDMSWKLTIMFTKAEPSIECFTDNVVLLAFLVQVFDNPSVEMVIIERN